MKSIMKAIQKFPMVSFFVILILLFVVISIGNSIREPEVEEKSNEEKVKTVQTQNAHQTPYVHTSGKVEKSDVITITAQVNALVKRVNIDTGDDVHVGKVLVNLADTYSGGVAASATRESAQRQVENSDETFRKEIDIIDDQRDDVGKTDSIEDEIARKQFTIAKRDLELEKDLRELEKTRAQIAEAQYFPIAPLDGEIERIFVRSGQTVSAGTPLMTLRGSGQETKVVVSVGKDIAKNITVEKPAKLSIGNRMVEGTPIHISKDAIDGQNYAVTFILPLGEAESLSDGEFIDVALPLKNGEAGNILVSLDAVQLTSDAAVIFVLEDGIARARNVELGTVFGQFVHVETGLQESDKVILNRNVLEGDTVKEESENTEE